MQYAATEWGMSDMTMNTEDHPAEELDQNDAPVEHDGDEESIEIDDALVGQVTDEADGDVRAVLEWLQDQLDEAREDRLRALAELRNNQRRASENEVRMSRAAVVGSLRALLPVLDQLEMALGQDTDGMSAEQFAQGVALARDEFIKMLAEQGVMPISPEVGDEFDPQRHEAMLQQEAEGVESGHITLVMQQGFESANHVLRAAKVAVAP